MQVPKAGTVIAEKYELVEEIGRGGMGVVWRAYAESLGLHCALKMVLPGFGAQRERVRLLREARIAARLRSPYIVNTYDVGEWDGCAFIAMELLEGQPLSALLRESEHCTPAFTVELIRQLALGLEKAHSAGLVHRDLKPDNIFVVEREPLLVKLLDFGVAKQLTIDELDNTAPQSTAGAIIGTPRYMSPEQAQGSALVDFRSDLWALAVIAYECLTGQHPFDGETWPQLLMNVCTGPLPVPSQHGATEAFDAFWEATAARDPAKRPASARAFADQLRAALRHAPPAKRKLEARAISIPPESVERRRIPVWVGAALGAAAVSGALGYLTIRESAAETPAQAPAEIVAVQAAADIVEQPADLPRGLSAEQAQAEEIIEPPAVVPTAVAAHGRDLQAQAKAKLRDPVVMQSKSAVVNRPAQPRPTASTPAKDDVLGF